MLFVLANDGLVPKWLGKTNEHKVLHKATVVSGVFMIVVAATAPFAALDDFISAGVLLCAATTNSCAIMIRRCEDEKRKEKRNKYHPTVTRRSPLSAP